MRIFLFPSCDDTEKSWICASAHLWAHLATLTTMLRLLKSVVRHDEGNKSGPLSTHQSPNSMQWSGIRYLKIWWYFTVKRKCLSCWADYETWSSWARGRRRRLFERHSHDRKEKKVGQVEGRRVFSGRWVVSHIPLYVAVHGGANNKTRNASVCQGTT